MNACLSEFHATDLFAGLTQTQREELLRMGSTRRLGNRDFIFEAGMPSDHVYIILEGRAKIFELSFQGKEVIMWFCLPGEVFGLAEVWIGSRRDVFAQACSEMKILEIPRRQFHRYLQANPDVSMLVIDVLAGRLRMLAEVILNLTSIDVSSRLVKLLSRLMLRYGKLRGDRACLEFPLTHQEMADMIGACRQTVTSTLGRLKQEYGLVVEHRKLSVPVARCPHCGERHVHHAADAISNYLRES